MRVGTAVQDEQAPPPGQDIKSRPVYAPIGLDATGLRHLLVTDAPDVPMQGLKAAPGVAPTTWPEVWLVCRDSRRPFRSKLAPDRPESEVHAFRSTALLLAQLERRLARETMGLRLYGIGSETFLADLRALGTAAGLWRAEMAFAHAGSLSRRVYCVHCKTITEGVTADLVTCTGCGGVLFVRDHFSSRLAAFMGVLADAEAPGELDAPRTLFP